MIKIFRQNWKWFWITVVVFCLLGTLFFFFQAKQYSVNLMLNVTRHGIQETADYRFDDFYRLQADERFADTVVRWLGSPIILEDIRKGSQVENLKIPKASRLSSQMIEVVFRVEDSKDAKKISQTTLDVLNKQTSSLDQFQQEKGWFVLVANEPFVGSTQIGWTKIFSVAFLLGIFTAFWVVLLRHYLKTEKG